MSNNNIGVTDKPIEKLENDLLEVKPYVTGLCSFISTCDTPMTISIQGDWGSGKTSMMNMIQANIEGTVLPIWFNTWQFSQFNMGDGLAFSMLDVLIDRLGVTSSKVDQIKSGLFKLARVAVVGVTSFFAGSEAAGAVKEATSGQGNTDVAKGILKLKDEFQEIVNEKLKEENRNRVVIFVDDLDRLEPAKAVELLEVLKLFLDCENCVFILAVDYDVVSTGIRQKYGKNVDTQKGRNFFDKIIQLPFKMPVANYDVKKYVQNMMGKIGVPITNHDETLFVDLIKSSIGFNPRAMKRLFNTYQLLDFVSRGTSEHIEDNIRQRLLFAVVCMQAGFEELYVSLVPGQFDAETLQSYISNEDADDALGELFPPNMPDSVIQEKKSKIRNFMPHFIKALQLDDDEALSDKELKNLRVILKSSSVTNFNNMEPAELEGEIWARRTYSKEMMKSVCEKIKAIGDFRVRIPRKRDEKGLLPTHAYCYTTKRTDNGIIYELAFYIDWRPDHMIEIGAELNRVDNHKSEELRYALGENPLKINQIPIWGEWGCHYSNLMCFNRNDYTIEQQLINLIRNILEGFNGNN